MKQPFINESFTKTNLYNLNPKDNYVLGTMLGNFQKARPQVRFSSARADGSAIRRTVCVRR